VPRIKWVIRTIPQSYAKHVLRQALQLENAKAIRQMPNRELEQTGLGELIRAGK
jgi:signal transduction protein with GAF and PtsI domain